MKGEAQHIGCLSPVPELSLLPVTPGGRKRENGRGNEILYRLPYRNCFFESKGKEVEYSNSALRRNLEGVLLWLSPLHAPVGITG